MSSSVVSLNYWTATSSAVKLSAPIRTTGWLAEGGVPVTPGSSVDSGFGGGIWLHCPAPSRRGREIRGSKARAMVQPVGKCWRGVIRRAVLASDMGAEEEVGRSRCFLRARNEEGATCYWFPCLFVGCYSCFFSNMVASIDGKTLKNVRC